MAQAAPASQAGSRSVGERRWNDDAGPLGKLLAEDGVLSEEGGDDGRCGVNLVPKSLALLPVVLQLPAETVDFLLLMLVPQGGGASADAVVPIREDGGRAVHGGSADAGLPPEVVLGQLAVGAAGLASKQALHSFAQGLLARNA